MKAAFKALRNAGYHMFLIYEYGLWKGYICDKKPFIQDGEEVTTFNDFRLNNMKAKDFLKDLLRWDLTTGSTYMKSSYELKIISGELKPRSLYYFSFKKSDLMAQPDVTLTLGGGDIQYLWEIDA